jgi:hypothetical protein
MRRGARIRFAAPALFARFAARSCAVKRGTNNDRCARRSGRIGRCFLQALNSWRRPRACRARLAPRI